MHRNQSPYLNHQYKRHYLEMIDQHGKLAVGKGALPDLNKVLGQSESKPPVPESIPENGEPPLKPVSIADEKPGQIADSAQDMVPQRCITY